MNKAMYKNANPCGDDSSLSTDTFIVWLISALSARGATSIAVDDVLTENRLRRAVEEIEETAFTFHMDGKNEMALELLNILEELRPNPNTGSMSDFWEALRRQQTDYRARFPNPSYKKLELCMNADLAKKAQKTVPHCWEKLVNDTADQIAK